MGHSERNRCDICGKELVFSEARPLGSGILCPDCAGSLSPFLDGLRRRQTSGATSPAAPKMKRCLPCFSRPSPLPETKRSISTRSASGSL